MADDAGPLYRQLSDEIDGTQWQQTLQQYRKPARITTPAEANALLYATAPKYGVDPRLAASIMGLESGGNTAAVSPKGAQGLMQLMPATARRFGVTDPLDAQQNIEGGLRYLSWLKSQFPGRVDLQLAAYHAGEGAVRNARYQVPNASDGNMTTQQYVNTIMARYQGIPSQVPGQPQMGLSSGFVEEATRPAPTAQDNLKQAEAIQSAMPPTPQVPSVDILSQEAGFRDPMSGMALAGPQTPAPSPGQPPGPNMPGAQPSLNPVLAEADLARGLQYQGDQPTYQQMLQGVQPLHTAGQLQTPGPQGQLQMPPGVEPPQVQAPGLRAQPLEAGVVEPRFPRFLGGMTAGAVGMVKNLFGMIQAGEALVGGAMGLKQPGQNDILGAKPIAEALGHVEQAVGPRLGGQAPDFFDKLANAIGTSLISRVPAAGALKFLGSVGKVAPGLARVGAAVSSGLIEAAGEAGDLFQEAAPLLGDQEAAKRALTSFANNAVLVTLTDRFGIFGDEARLLRRTLNGIVMNGVQEAAQYDIERRLLWVPATHPAAEALKAQGWTVDGDRVVKPFVAKDMAEAAVIGAVIGGPAAAMVGSQVEQMSPQGQAMRAQEAQAVRAEMPATKVTTAEGQVKAVYPTQSTPVEQFVPTQPTQAEYGTGFYFQEQTPAAPEAGQMAHPVYLNMTQPFDLTAPIVPQAQLTALESAVQARDLERDVQGVTPQAIYESLSRAVGPTETTAVLQQAGFDGIIYGPAESQGYVVFDAAQIQPALSVYGGVQAMLNPETPPPGVSPAAWYRWGQMFAQAAGGQEQAISGAQMAERASLLRQRSQAQQQLNALEQGGETAQTVLEQMGQTDPVAASTQIQERLAGIEQQLQTLRAPQAPGMTGARPDVEPQVPGSPQQPVGPGGEPSAVSLTGQSPTLAAGAAGLTPETYKTASGDWKIPRKDIPSRELELKDFIGQKGYIRLAGETDVPEELAARISVAAVGRENALQNDVSGKTLDQMAQAAQQDGFIRTADKQELLDALDRSVIQGQPVYSAFATGHVNIIENPYVASSYQAVNNAITAMRALSEQQVGGVQRRAEIHERAREAGQLTLADLQMLFPDARMDEPNVLTSQLLQSLNTMGENMGKAAQAYLDSGARLGSREEQALQDTMALFAEMDPYRLGLSAQLSRGLGILNDPLSGYTQYLNALHATLEKAPAHTMETNARRILASRPDVVMSQENLRQHPEMLDALFAQHYDMVGRFEARAQQQAQMQPQGAWRALPVNEQLDFLKQLGDLPWGQADIDGANNTAAFLREHLNTDQAQRLSEALRPWEGRHPQAEMTQIMAHSSRLVNEQAQDFGMAPLQTERVKPVFKDYFLELWFNALLSNPATHIANVTSNTATTLWAIPERFFAEQMGMGAEGHVARGESVAMLYALVHATNEAWVGAARSWEQGTPVSGLGREYAREPITAERMGIDSSSTMGKFVDFFFNYVGLASGGRLASRALMAADEFAKMLNYRMELNALAYREAVKQGYEGSAWREHVASIVSNPQLAQIQEAATSFAGYQTFQEALDSNRPLASRFQQFSDIELAGIPVGKLILPFVSTPGNIMRYAVERTPLGLGLRSMRDDLQAGGVRSDIAASKVLLGTLAMTGLAKFVMSGDIVGRAPEDPELREVWLQRHREYSFRLPLTNMWVPYDRFEPFGSVIGMVADFMQIQGEAGYTSDTERVVTGIAYSLVKNIGSRNYFQSLNRFFDAMSPKAGQKTETFGENVWKYIVGEAAQLSQPSALLAATARVFDPAEVDAKGYLERLYARIPGWRGDVPARRTLGGEKILYGMGWGPDMLVNMVNAYTPWKLGDGMIYPADKEILDNRMHISRPPRSLEAHALPEGAMATGLFDPAGTKPLRLTEQQYEKFAVLAGGNQAEAQKLGLELPGELLDTMVENLSYGFAQQPPSGTRSLDDYLHWMIQQPEYLALEQGPDGTRAGMYKTVVETYRKVGLELLKAQEPAIQARIEEAMKERLSHKLPLEERRSIIDQMSEGFQEARPQAREALGLTRPSVGAGR